MKFGNYKLHLKGTRQEHTLALKFCDSTITPQEYDIDVHYSAQIYLNQDGKEVHISQWKWKGQRRLTDSSDQQQVQPAKAVRTKRTQTDYNQHQTIIGKNQYSVHVGDGMQLVLTGDALKKFEGLAAKSGNYESDQFKIGDVSFQIASVKTIEVLANQIAAEMVENHNSTNMKQQQQMSLRSSKKQPAQSNQKRDE